MIRILGFRAPHRNTVKKNIKRLNSVHTKKLMTQLNDAYFIAITTDFWCDWSAKSYLCMTGHWYNNDMILKSKVLVFTPYVDRHTSENISSELQQRLTQLKIFEKTTTITCDGASNIKASFKRMDARIKRLQCLAHKLHLIVCNALGLWVNNSKQVDENETTGKKSIEKSRWCMPIWLHLMYMSKTFKVLDARDNWRRRTFNPIHIVKDWFRHKIIWIQTTVIRVVIW